MVWALAKVHANTIMKVEILFISYNLDIENVSGIYGLPPLLPDDLDDPPEDLLTPPELLELLPPELLKLPELLEELPPLLR